MSNRKRYLLVRAVICLLAIILALLSTFIPQAMAAKAPGVIEVNLPNGLKVLILEEYSFPVVSCAMWYHVGSRNELAGTTGISHLVEHLLFGNVGIFKKGDIGSAIIRNGGHFNGFTSDDFTTFFETLPAAKLDLALKIESERMHKAKFTQKEIDGEASNIAAEFERKSKDPVEVLAQEVRAEAYQEHPYHNPTMGWLNDVRNINVDEAQKFYQRYFCPNNATLVIAGDVKASSVVNEVKKYFAGIGKSNQVECVIPQEPEPKGERRASIKFAGKQEILEVAYHIPAVTSGDAPALSVLEELFNAEYSGRLKTKLVASKIANSAQAALGARKDPGLFTITITAPLGTGEAKLLDTLDATISGIKSALVPDADLRRSKNLAEFAYENEKDGPYHAGFFLGYSDCLDSWQLTKTWTDKLRAVTAGDIAKVSRQYFNPDERVVGFLYNPTYVKPQTPAKQTPQDTPPGTPEPRPYHPGRQFMHTHLTGYKLDDTSSSPESENKKTNTGDAKPADSAEAGTHGPNNDSSASSASGASAASSASPTGTKSNTTSASPASTTSDTTSASPASTTSDTTSATTINATSKTDANHTAGDTTRPLPIQGAITPAGNPVAPNKAELPDTTVKPAIVEIKHFQERVLKNGLKVVVFESHLSPIIQIDGAILAGDAFEPASKKGLASLVTAVFNSGSQKHSHLQFCQQEEDLGLSGKAMLTFEDGKDSINFQTRCLSRDLPSQLNILCETLTQPNLQDDDLSQSKQDEIAAIKQQESSLESRVKRVLLTTLVSNKSPYCPSEPMEKIKNIGAFKTADVRDYISQHVLAGATTIVFAGDITLDQATHSVESSLASFESQGHEQMPAARVVNKHVLKTTLPQKDKEAVIALGQMLPIPSTNHEYAALLVANCILSSHPLFARLPKCLSQSPQLAAISDNLTSQLEPLSYESIWSALLPTEPELMVRAQDALTSELKSFSQLGMTQEELAEAKRYLIGHLELSSMSTLSKASRAILTQVEQGNDGGYLARLLNEINGENLENVNRFIRTTFKPEQATVVLAAPPEFLKPNRTTGLAKNPTSDKLDPPNASKP
jgi:zinc protease